ncbi:MAG: glycerol-3-phosphate acyltransferase [Acidobacteriia bacterium]|nr:glycerol-3-phosphate acyltransferase [Terriglobia bacterium]
MKLPPSLLLVLSPLLAYLIGSISFSFLLGRIRRRDLRTAGSGNLGAMNTARILGPVAGFIVLALDMAKGFAAARLAQEITRNEMAVLASCLAVLLGHNYSLFLRFSGGKGLATVGGFLLVISPITFFAELVIAGGTYLFSRDVHHAAVAMIVTFAPLLGLFTHSWKYFMLGLAVAGLSGIRHKKEFRQLLGRFA